LLASVGTVKLTINREWENNQFVEAGALLLAN